MLRSAQGLTLCQAANYPCGLPLVRGLTQGQALQNPAIRVTSVNIISINHCSDRGWLRFLIFYILKNH
jgi:hypothetical protein